MKKYILSIFLLVGTTQIFSQVLSINGPERKQLIAMGYELDKEEAADVYTVANNGVNKMAFTKNKDRLAVSRYYTRKTLNQKDEFELMNFVVSRGAIFISTPFSRAAANRLAKFDVPAFKIGSGECNNYPLVRHIAKFGKPIILSTGMNSIESIRPSVEIMRKAKIPFALLHCTNIYPTPHKLVRLNAILELKNEFPDAVVGLSDHTTSNYTSFGAVSLGASILERHFTDNMKRLGPDISSSMDINALQQLIEGSRIIFEALSGDKSALPEESATISFAFASVVAIRDIQPGEVLSEENIWVKRPSGGDFSAREFDELLGRIAKNKLINGYQIKKIDLMP